MNMQDCWSFTCCFSVGITLVYVLQKWLNWFHFLFLKGGLLVIPIDCMIFLSPFRDATRTSMSTVFFPCTTRLWDSLPIECFPLTCDFSVYILELTDIF